MLAVDQAKSPALMKSMKVSQLFFILFSCHLPKKPKTPPSSSASNNSSRGRNPLHPPNTDSKDMSPDEDENVRPPFHKLRRHRMQGSPPPPIPSGSHLSPQIDSPPKLEPVGEQGYHTTLGGSMPEEPKSPSPDPLNIGKLLVYAFQDTPQTLK